MKKVKLDPKRIGYDGKGFYPIFTSLEKQNEHIEKLRQNLLKDLKERKNEKAYN